MKDDVDFELTTPISRKEILESEKVQKIPNIEKTESKKNIPFFERIKRSKKADIDPIILEIQNGLETNFVIYFLNEEKKNVLIKYTFKLELIQ